MAWCRRVVGSPMTRTESACRLGVSTGRLRLNNPLRECLSAKDQRTRSASTVRDSINAERRCRDGEVHMDNTSVLIVTKDDAYDDGVQQIAEKMASARNLAVTRCSPRMLGLRLLQQEFDLIVVVGRTACRLGAAIRRFVASIAPQVPVVVLHDESGATTLVAQCAARRWSLAARRH